jgi:hypothetical protein
VTSQDFQRSQEMITDLRERLAATHELDQPIDWLLIGPPGYNFCKVHPCKHTSG